MNEMDLMKSLREVPSPSPEAYDRARTALHAAMAEPVDTVVRPKRWFSWPKVSVAAVGAAAVAAAVVMGTTGGKVPAGPPEAAAPPVVVESPLVKLASEVKAAGASTGDSSLVITTKPGFDNIPPYVDFTIYTDKGQIFHGDSVKSLGTAITKGNDDSQPYDAKVLAAARLAANGDVEKARVAMITASNNALGVGLSPAEAEKAWADAQAKVAEEFRKIGKPVPAPRPRPTGKELENLIDNHLWSNTTHALFLGAANAEVRAGVLKLFATIQDMTIGKAEVDGRPVLTLTAPPAILGGGGAHVLTVDAGTGLPIRGEVVPAKDSAEPSKPSVVTYKSSRVNLADVVAGKI